MNNMKNLKICLLIGIASVFLLSCNNSKNVTAEEIAEETAEEGKWEIQIDPKLKELGKLNVKLLEYEDVYEPENGMITVVNDKKWGLINKDCKEVLKCVYKSIYYDEIGDVWKVDKNDSIGIVDNRGVFMSDLTKDYNLYHCLGGGLVLARSSRLHTADADYFKLIVSMKSREVLLKNVQNANPLSDGVIMALPYGGNYKMYSYDGESLSEYSEGYSHFKGYGEGLFCVANNHDGKYGFVNAKGEIVIPFEFESCSSFSDGMAAYKDSTGFSGFIDKTGAIVIPAQFDYVCDFSDGLAYVRNDQIEGFIDKSGKVIIDTKGKYSECGFGFKKGFCVVESEDTDGMGIINKKGENVTSLKYKINMLHDDVYTAHDQEKSMYGAFSYDGKQIVPFKFDYLSNFNNGWALATIEDVKLIINKEGKTGILNLEELLAIKKEEKEQERQYKLEHIEEYIKEQLVEMINKNNHRKILDSPSDLENFAKDSEGNYKARFTIYGEYEHFTHDVLNIKVDEDGKVLSFDVQLFRITPTDKKPDGTADPNEIMRRKIQGLQY